MKKMLFVLAVSTMLLSSCSTYTGQGAYTGATLGSILGSAIGGISGGWHGSHVGEIVGMAGGAAVGAAIGSAADKKEAERYEDYRRRRLSVTRTIAVSAKPTVLPVTLMMKTIAALMIRASTPTTAATTALSSMLLVPAPKHNRIRPGKV